MIINMDEKIITLSLTKEQYEILIGELYTLESYKENDDHIGYLQNYSKILGVIEEQADPQLRT
jgi:hypothetical protein